MGRAPKDVAGEVRGDGVAVRLKPAEQDLLQVGHHLGPLDLGEAGLAELHHDPHVGRVDVPGVELAVGDLDTLDGGGGVHAQLFDLADEQAGDGFAEVDRHLLVGRRTRARRERVQPLVGGDLDERHVPLLSERKVLEGTASSAPQGEECIYYISKIRICQYYLRIDTYISKV